MTCTPDLSYYASGGVFSEENIDNATFVEDEWNKDDERSSEDQQDQTLLATSPSRTSVPPTPMNVPATNCPVLSSAPAANALSNSKEDASTSSPSSVPSTSKNALATRPASGPSTSNLAIRSITNHTVVVPLQGSACRQGTWMRQLSSDQELVAARLAMWQAKSEFYKTCNTVFLERHKLELEKIKADNEGRRLDIEYVKLLIEKGQVNIAYEQFLRQQAQRNNGYSG